MVKINTEGFVPENGLMDFPATSFMAKSVLTVWPIKSNTVSQEMIKTVNPFGDGKASQRIVSILLDQISASD